MGERVKEMLQKAKPLLKLGLLFVVVIVAVWILLELAPTPGNPEPVVVEKVVAKEVEATKIIQVEKNVYVTATSLPPTPVPPPTPIPAPTPTLRPIQVTEAEWEKICAEMLMYNRDCSKNLNCKRSNDPQRCILYSEEVATDLLNTRSVVDQWATEYADKIGKDRTWVISVVGKVMTDPRVVNREIGLQEAWEYWKTY